MKSSISLAPLKALLLVIALMAITIAPGCIIAANKKNEKKVEKTYSISEFSAISASAGIKVIYTQGKSTGIAKVTTTESGEKYLVVEVKSGCLKLYYDSQKWKKGVNINGPTVVTVQSPTLRAVDLSSAASLQANGVINQSAMIEFNLSSAANVTVNTINCDNLQADLSSSASLSVNNFSGTNLTLVGSSASSASFDKVTCKRGAWLHTSSAAGMSINRITGETLSGEASSGSRITVDNINCKNVDGDASSGASVNLSGKCTMLKKESSSGGSVNTKNLSHSVLSDNTNSYNNAVYYTADAKAAQEAGRKAQEEGRKAAEQARKEAQIAREQALKAAQVAREEAYKAAEQARKEAQVAREQALKEAQVAREEARKAAEQARKEAQAARKEARKAQKKALAANKKAKNTKKTESSDKSKTSNKIESDGFLRIP